MSGPRQQRILIDARMLSATGIGRYTRNLLRELPAVADRSQQFAVLVQPDDIERVPESLRPVAREVPLAWYSAAEQMRLGGYIAREAPDLVHFPQFNVPLAYRGPFVVTIHDLTMHRFKSIRGSAAVYAMRQAVYLTVLSRAVSRAQRVFVPSEFTKSDLVSTLKVDPGKVVVTYEGGPEEDSWRGEPETAAIDELGLAGSQFLLTVGTAFVHKNLEVVIRALPLLPPEYKLAIVGKGDVFHQRLVDLAVQIGVSDRVVMTGYASDARLAALYGAAAAFVFPSFNEGFGLPGLEAMGLGTPVIASSASCLPEILGDAALFFDPRSAEELARQVLVLGGDPEMRSRMASAGIVQAARYSWRRMAEQTNAVYMDVLEDLARPPSERRAGLG
ncbi:MAG: glycosyltransferase family 4 protein [Coriobacteriia bacterium]|nr:glycosyltransferase family 4 protein [Coriobacteriia bacterium]